MARIITVFILAIALQAMASLEAFDKEFIGVNYKGFPQSDSEITADIQLLSQHFSFIRTYMELFTPQQAVVPIVDAHNEKNPAHHIDVAVGVGLTPGDTKKSFEELDIAISQANQYPNTVNVIVVGNENLGNVSEADLIMFMDYVRKNVKSPTSVAVTTCQTWGVWAGHPKLGDHVDFILANIYPYWDGAPINEWNRYFLQDFNKLKDTFPGKEIIIGETGWPSAGQQVMVDGHLTGIPSLPNEQQYILEYSKWASANKIRTYLFSSFDEPWKENSEPGKVGSHFGLYTVDSQPKFPFNPSAAASPLAYAFTLTYANGDQYNGIVYGEPEFGYTVGPVLNVIDEDGNMATYEITAVTTSVNGIMGTVYVYNYYDAESERNFDPVDFRTAVGLNFLGSESGHIIKEGTSAYFFGADHAAGVHFEADLKVGNESKFRERQGWGAGLLPPGRLKRSGGAGLIPEGQKKKFGQ